MLDDKGVHLALPPEIKSLYFVDDEPQVLLLMKKVIKIHMREVRVRTFEDAQTAFKVLKTAPPDVLITDLRMPGLSGTQLVMLARNKFKHLPIVVVSGVTLPKVLQDIRYGSSLEFIEKPFTNEQLFKAIGKAHAECLAQSKEETQSSVFPLLDVIQMHHLERVTGRLDIAEGKKQASVWFKRGHLVHAVAEGLEGQGAVLKMLGWLIDRVEFAQGMKHPATTINLSIEELVHLIDDSEFKVELDGSSDSEKPESKTLSPAESLDSTKKFPSGVNQQKQPDHELKAGEKREKANRGKASERKVTKDSQRDLELESVELFLDEPDHHKVQRSETSKKNIPNKPEKLRQGEQPMGNAQSIINELSELDGFIGACVTDLESGMMLASSGEAPVNLELASAGNSEVLRAKYKTMEALNLENAIEDILITLGQQYHLLRPLQRGGNLFVYLVLDRATANLGLGRLFLKQVEETLKI